MLERWADRCLPACLMILLPTFSHRIFADSRHPFLSIIVIITTILLIAARELNSTDSIDDTHSYYNIIQRTKQRDELQEKSP